MSIHAVAWAKQVQLSPSGEKINRSEKLVLLCLADYLNIERGYAWPSVARLASECLLSERQCRNVLRSLEGKGFILTEARCGETNAYRFAAMPGVDVWANTAVTQNKKSDEVKLSATSLVEGLVGEGGVLDGYLADHVAGRIDDIAQVYLNALLDADALASEFDGLSKDLRGHLRNAVMIRCAADTHGIGYPQAGRLTKEAKLLGVDGHRWIVVALLHTASAAISGDPTSYVISTARRRAAETKGVSR